MTNTSDNTVQLGDSPQEKIAQGDSTQEKIAQGDSPQEKIAQGDSPQEMIAQGNSPQEMIAQGDSPQEMIAQGDSPQEMIAQGNSSQETTPHELEELAQVESPLEKAETNIRNEGALTAQQVKGYLQENPEFFANYPSLSETLKVPHQQKGSVSLVELQSEQLRDRMAELQKKLSELMSVARQNEDIYRTYADLNLRLFHCKSLQDIKAALHQSVCEELKLTDVALHLFAGEGALPEKHRQAIVDKRLSKSDFFFGRLTQDENPLLFADKQPQSVVIMRLKHDEEIGLVAIGSDDEGHFHPGMDTLLITQLQQFLSLLIPKVQE